MYLACQNPSDLANMGDPLGFSIRRGFKKIGRGIKRGAKATGRGVATGAKYAGKGAKVGAKYSVKAAVAPTKAVLKLSRYAMNKLLSPIRSRFNTVVTRRARKLAYDRRRTTTFTPAERKEAYGWTKHQFRKKGYHGRLIAALNGPPDYVSLGEFGATGVEEAAIAVGVAVLTKLATNTLNSLAKGGAPADPTKGVSQAATAALVQQARPGLEQRFGPIVRETQQELAPAAQAYRQATTVPVEAMPTYAPPTYAPAAYEQPIQPQTYAPSYEPEVYEPEMPGSFDTVEEPSQVFAGTGLGADPGVVGGRIALGLGVVALGVGVFAATRR